MILKVLDHKQSAQQNVVYDVWNYFDNITSASNFYHEESDAVVVCCTFRDGNTVTIAVPHEAYLMSDYGKTIERIYDAGDRGCPKERFDTLQEAIDFATEA